MGGYLGKVLAVILTVTIGILFLPVMQEGIDALTGSGMVYEDTSTGSLLGILPIVVTAGVVFFAVPKNKS